MNAVAKKLHYTVVLAQMNMMLEQLAEQYGAWLLLSPNDVNLDARGTMQQIYEMANGVTVKDKRRRALPRCKIQDYQADAIKELIDDMRETDSEVVQEWVKCFELYYVDGYRQEDVAKVMRMSETGVAETLKCAKAHICARRPSIKSFFTTKSRKRLD